MFKVLLILFIFLPISTAHAFKWFEASFGLAVYRYSNIRSHNQKKFLDKDPIYEPIPTAQLRLGPIFINKEGAGVALLFFKNVKLLGLVLYEGEAYKAKGMLERKRSFHVGGGLRFFDLEGIYYQDVQSKGHGRVLKIVYAPEFVSKNYTFSPRLYVQFWNRKYVDYYYGVRPEEVDNSIGRYRYTGQRTNNYGLMFRNIWDVGRFKYVIAAGYKYYGNRVYESPTVSKRGEQRIVMGFMYKFF